ncbi:CBS domain-containing protein [Desulfotignum phosphitoxidans]|jgi:nanoRNase/pAp phosphatase (c-di-AMP/oligoRNAs hydrolase)|uniref:Exopolyphosphatase-like protein n=1 Tax=Desulfotignum phosphitoxidans DSM 13687 TaxID=1286635 RepID=S0G7L7_9BACT|nr:CBS domain-containing protein [Desulfotignum phosphitoxidans]EMS81016.1 exopolyphosphatase-like protein [Desulfotignum phosphitoxidans DSM 13687]
MQIVTSHMNTDFDALASMVACTCLYPGTRGVVPSHVTAGVRAFLSIHQDLLRIVPRKGFDLETVSSLIVVDTNNWNRLDRMQPLKDRQNFEIICWDHHMSGTNIISGVEHREEVGATITLLLEEMERQQTPFTPMQATLFLLGIYDDTGCLTFSSATPRDARMTAFLLENGADLNIVSSFLSNAMDDSHTRVFSDMLAKADVLTLEGVNIGICAIPVQSGLTMLASLVEKYKEFKGLDAVFGIFSTDQNKVMVIGRSNPDAVDVGAVVRALGGGGHPGAGSAVVKEDDLAKITEKITTLIRETGRKSSLVKEIMLHAARFVLRPDQTVAEAGEIMARTRVRALLVCDKDRFLGLIPESAVVRARQNNRLSTPVKGMVKPDVPVVGPGDDIRTAAARMNQSQEGMLPVLEQGRVAGVLTRGSLVLHMYDM